MSSSLDELRELRRQERGTPPVAAQEKNREPDEETDAVDAPVSIPPRGDGLPSPDARRRVATRRPVKRTKLAAAPTSPPAVVTTDNSVNKIKSELNKDLNNSNVHKITKSQNHKPRRKWKDCSRSEIASAQQEVNGFADSTEKHVGSRCGAVLWNQLSDIKGDDPVHPYKMQDLLTQAVKLRVMFELLGLDIKEFLGE